MEVVCGSKRFIVASTPCRKELQTLGVVKVIIRERNQAIALAVGWNTEKHRVAGAVEVLHSKIAGCASRDKMVYWCSSLNIFGSQLFDH